MVEKITFADSWQRVFAEFGLKSFQDFFNYSSGPLINKNSKRDVRMITFSYNKSCRVFFLKRFYRPHLKDIISAWRHYRLFTSQAAVEWNNANTLLRHNIKTYIPLCLGEQTCAGVERKSFLVTERLQATPLSEFITNKWNQLDRAARERVITAIAKLVRCLHSLNISLPDLYTWHIFIDSAENLQNRPISLSVIDLHRMRQATKSQTTKIKDLGSLFWSMPPECFNKELKELFLQTYTGQGSPAAQITLAKAIGRRERKIAKRRRRRPYRPAASVLSRPRGGRRPTRQSQTIRRIKIASSFHSSQ